MHVVGVWMARLLLGTIVETAPCQTHYQGLSKFRLATEWIKHSPGPWSMGLVLKRGPLYDTKTDIASGPSMDMCPSGSCIDMLAFRRLRMTKANL